MHALTLCHAKKRAKSPLRTLDTRYFQARGCGDGLETYGNRPIPVGNRRRFRSSQPVTLQRDYAISEIGRRFPTAMATIFPFPFFFLWSDNLEKRVEKKK